MKEQTIQNQIRAGVSDIAIIFRGNVGKVRMADGRFFDTGLPLGFSDLFGFRKSDHKIFFIEVKNETGILRKEQIQFLNAMKNHGCIVGVARSLEDARNIIQGVSEWTT